MKPATLIRHQRAKAERAIASAFCKTPRKVSKAELLNALHQAHTQLVDAQWGNQKPALHSTIRSIGGVLARAGHTGFAR